MGSSSSAPSLRAEEVITPAVAKTISQDTEAAQARQADMRSRMRGISSTYNRWSQMNGDAFGKKKLGE